MIREKALLFWVWLCLFFKGRPYDDTAPWQRWVPTAWYAILGLLVLYEAWTQLDRNHRTPPLTRVMLNEVPWYVMMPVLTWLWVHFASRYAGLKWWF